MPFGAFGIPLVDPPRAPAGSRIYVLKEGYCCEQGTHQQLMAQGGTYYNMASLQWLDGRGKSGGGARQAAHAKRNDVQRFHPKQAWVGRMAFVCAGDPRPAGEHARQPTGLCLRSHDGLGASLRLRVRSPGSWLQLPDLDDNEPDETKRKPVMRRLLRTARPDWGVIPIALLAVLLAACLAPFQVGPSPRV